MRDQPLLTTDRLQQLAADYVGRYGGTRQNLRRYLHRVLRKALHRDPSEDQTLHADWRQACETVIANLTDAGALDDARFAEAATRVWQARGMAAPVVRQRLAARGVDAGAVQQALETLAQEAGGSAAPLAVATAYARRRGFGPWRAPNQRAARRDKDLQAMLRAGHPFAVAREVIDGTGELADDQPGG